MKVSIVIPVYNVAEYIVACLESVTSQTYQGAMECLLIDDCGKDDSMETARDFVEKYRGNIDFRMIHHRNNRGLSASRNTGIRESTGDYVYFLDSDDAITPRCIEQIVAVLSEHPDCDMIQAGAFATRELEPWFSMEKKMPDYADNPEWILRTLLMRGGPHGFPVTAWNRLVRRDFLIENNLFFKEGILHEDELWGFMLARKVRRLGICRHNTYIYRIRENSIMTNLQSNDEKVYALLDVWDEMIANVGGVSKKTQIRMIWRHIDEFYPLELSEAPRQELRKRLERLVDFRIFPVCLLIYFYLRESIADLHKKGTRRRVKRWMHTSMRFTSPRK